MNITPGSVCGVFLVDITPSRDERGFFARTFDTESFANHGLVSSFSQQGIAYNEVAGTVRGLHYQMGFEEVKLVRVTSGAIMDVAVDLRRSSPTFGRVEAVELSAGSRRALYVPAGCAHGYQTLEDDTEVSYLISGEYNAARDHGIHYADPHLAISWPLSVTRISSRDAGLPSFAEAGFT